MLAFPLISSSLHRVSLVAILAFTFIIKSVIYSVQLELILYHQLIHAQLVISLALHAVTLFPA